MPKTSYYDGAPDYSPERRDNPGELSINPQILTDDRDIDLEYLLEEAQKLIVPLYYFYGSQAPSNYEAKKRRAVEKGYKQAQADGDAFKYLLSHPIISCIIEANCPEVSELEAIIYNGHHKYRYAPQYGVNQIATFALTPEQIAAYKGFDTEEFANYLQEQSALTTHEFALHMGDKAERQPRPIAGFRSLTELAEYGRIANVSGLTARSVLAISTFEYGE